MKTTLFRSLVSRPRVPRSPVARSLAPRSLAVLALVGVMVLAAVPVAAQESDDGLPVDVPGLGEITGLEDLVDLPGLDLADPVLDPVTGVVDQLSGLVDDVLADTPLANLLALQGEDAIDAAVAFSQATYDTNDTALIARDDLFADALTTGALQGLYDAPLLLTESGDLDPRTAQELVRLGVDRLVIVGGDDAVTPLVRQKLDVAGITVERIGGATRIETAADAAAQTAPDATTAVLSRAYSSTADEAQAYADLLSVSPWAAQNGWPVLLSQSDVLTASVREHIAASSLQEIVVIGGTQAISDAVVTELEDMGLTVRRVAGDNRFSTATAIAGERGFVDSGDTERLILAEGAAVREDIWAPGFAAAAHGALNDAPILLTSDTTLPQETMAFITDGMADNLLDGGPATLCASFVNPIACEAAGLLLLGNVNDALDVLGLGLIDLPNLEDLLTQLGLEDLLAVLDAVDGVLDGVVDGLSAGDLDAVVEALSSSTAEVEGLVDGLVDGLGGGEETGSLDDLLDGLLGGDGGDDGEGDGLGDVVDGLLGGDDSEDTGDASEDDLGDTIDDTVDDVIGVLGG